MNISSLDSWRDSEVPQTIEAPGPIHNAGVLLCNI